ncbi:MAG: LpqB family beta-propeller domain-containing protein [Verrucomicrobiia bacterium]
MQSIRASVCEAGEVKIWNINDAGNRHLCTHEDGAAALTFSPDGETLATAGNDTDIKIWAVRDGETLVKLQGHDEGVTCLAFHPNGRRLASGSDDDTVIIWNLQTNEIHRRLRHDADVNTVSFSKDGTRLASAAADGVVKIWVVPEE